MKMKFFDLVFVVAICFEAAVGQCLRTCGSVAAPACLPAAEVVYSPTVAATPAIIQSNSVAANLADTLSLLTVSTLLAEKLPLGCSSIVANVPIASGYGCGCGCGGGCGCGYGPYGYVL